MARDRVNTGFGPSALTVTNSATSAAAVYSTWIRWGPFKGSNLAYMTVLGSTTSGQKVRMQGRITSGSSRGQASFALATGVTQVVATTAAGTYSWVRVASTVMAGSVSHVVHFIATA